MTGVGAPPEQGRIHSTVDRDLRVFSFAAVDLAIGLPVSLAIKPVNVWGYFGFMSSTAILATYLDDQSLACRRSIHMITRSEFSVIQHVVFPAVASLFTGYVLKSLLYPVPAQPYRYLPFAVRAYVALGAIYVVWPSRRRPELLPAAARALEGGDAEPNAAMDQADRGPQGALDV